MAKKKKKDKKPTILVLVLAIAVIAVLSYLISVEVSTSKNKQIVAKINTEKVSFEDLQLEFDRLPLQYQGIVFKPDLLEQMIDLKLLLQIAERKEIIVPDADVQFEIDALKNQFQDEAELNEFLESQKYTLDEFSTRRKEQMVVSKLFNETVLYNITVSDREILLYYNENINFFVDDEGNSLSLNDIREPISDLLYRSKSAEAVQDYITEAREGADIEIDPSYIVNEFTITGDEVCMDDDIPIMRIYTASTCPVCEELTPVFDAAVEEYEFVVKKFQLDSDKLSSEELEILKKYNPDGAVPAFVFGCKYVRMGRALGAQDLLFEAEEFTLVLDELE